MKTLLLLALAAGSMVLASGCAPAKLGRNEFLWTPAYTATERFNMIERNWDYEGKQLQDDVDHALLLRPASHLTVWNVQ